MTEPPRPSGEGNPGGPPPEPTSPPPPPWSNPKPGEAPYGGYNPPPAAPQYETPSTAPPPGGGYPPAGGYPPPGGYYGAGGVPIGFANNDEKTWALIAHFGGPVGVAVGGGVLGWVAPFIVMMAKGPQSPIVRAHSVAALNFQITWAIAVTAGWLLALVTCGILSFVPLLAGLVPVIFGIIGGVKANEGQLYRYPLTYNFVR